MAYQLAQAYVQIVPSMKGVGKAIENAFDGPSKSTGQKAGQSIGSGLSGGFAAKVGAVAGIASTVFSKVASVVTGSLNSAISRADQMNNFPKVMKNLGYSSEDAAASIKKISSALDGLPTTSSAMTGMVQQLAPLTSNLDEATDIALAFNNAMLAGGASTVEQENALTQYTQMLSAGKVDMQAWRSIQAAMPGQLNQVAEALLGAGKNGNDLYEAMKDGTVSFDDFNNAVVKLNKQGFGQYASFAQQAKDATQGIGTAMENVQNRVAKAVQKVVEAVGVENIAGAINGFSSQFGKVGDAAASMVTGVKNWLGQLWQALKDNGALSTFKGLWDGLKDALSSIGQTAVDWAKIIPPGTAANAIKLIADALDLIVRTAGKLSPVLVPAITALIGFKAANAGITAVSKGLEGVFTAATSVKNIAGAVTTAFNGIGGVGAAFKSLASNIGLVQNATNLAKNAQLAWNQITTAGKAVAMAFGTAARNIGSAVASVTSTLWANITALARSAAAWVAQKVALIASKVATAAATAAQWLLNAAMSANPIMLLVTAIAALVAALVWFFTQTEAGRQLWAKFTGFLQSTWQNITDFFQTTWQNITQWFSNAAANIQNGWNALTAFIGSIPGRMQVFFAGIGQWFANKFDEARNGITSAFNNAVSFVASIPGRITGFFGSIGSWFANKFNEVRNGIANGFNSAVSFVASIPGRILNALGNLGGLLWNAGASIMRGFLNGLKSVWGNITSFVGNIAGWIASHKGPLPYDRRLLIPAGEAIMGGFRKSLNAGWQQVQSDVAGMNVGLANGFKTPAYMYGGGQGMDYTPNTGSASNVNITNYYPQADPWPLATNDSLDKLTVGI